MTRLRTRQSLGREVPKLSELDLSTIDVRKIAPAEWEAVKHEVMRRARRAREGVA